MSNVNTPGYYAIMAEVKMMHGNGDPWGTNVAWLFALADYMWYGGFDKENPSYELQTIMDILEQWEDHDIRQVYKVLSRYDDWLKAAGMNY